MTLADSCMAEIARVRDEVMPAYQEIGDAGVFALTMMRATIDDTTRALAEGDATKLLALHERLRGFST